MRSALTLSTTVLKKAVELFGNKEKPRKFKRGISTGKNPEKEKGVNNVIIVTKLFTSI